MRPLATQLRATPPARHSARTGFGGGGTGGFQHNVFERGLNRGGEIHLTLFHPLLRLARRATKQGMKRPVGHAQAAGVVELFHV